MINKIISGGQTGVDRAGLNVAMELGIATGGWCPAGRRAEDGIIPERYNTLSEANSRDYANRTELNVRDSDATLILNLGSLTEGSQLTSRFTENHNKPVLICQFDTAISLPKVAEWLKQVDPTTLNIAGPRESERPGIHDMAHGFLIQLLR